MASDALPFRDGVDVAAEYGIAVVIQPAAACATPSHRPRPTRASMAMVFTGMRRPAWR